MCATVHSDPAKAGAPISMSRMTPIVWESSWPTHGPSIINLIILAIPAPYISRISFDLHLSKWTEPSDQNKVKSRLSTPLNLRPTNQGVTVIHYLFDWSDLDLFTPHPWLVRPHRFSSRQTSARYLHQSMALLSNIEDGHSSHEAWLD